MFFFILILKFILKMRIIIILQLMIFVNNIFMQLNHEDVFLTSFIDQQVTLTCSITLDKRNFSISGDYKVIKNIF